MAGRRNHIGIVHQLHRRRDAGLRVGGIVEHHAFDREGIIPGIGLFDGQEKAVLRAQALLGVAAAQRADEAELDQRLVLREGRRGHQCGREDQAG